MKKTLKTIYPSLKLAVILVAAAVVTGCISAKAPPTEAAVPAVPAVPVTPTEPEALTKWTVAKGEHLWGISGAEEVYNLPEQWPLLYKSNIDKITDADLIYPGQVLEIPRDSSQAEIDAAIHHAKNRGAWAVGPIELTDKEYLKNSP